MSSGSIARMSKAPHLFRWSSALREEWVAVQGLPSIALQPCWRRRPDKLRCHDQCWALPAVVCTAAVCHYSVAWFITPCANFDHFSASASFGRGESTSATHTDHWYFFLSPSQCQQLSLSGYLDCNVVTY